MGSIVYLNGELLPEEQAKISIFDIGFMYSAVFMEALRTFRHRMYRLEDHLERLERSMKAAGLEPLISRDEMARVMQTTIDANISHFEEDNDCWICAQVTPGTGFPQPLMRGKRSRPTVMAYVSALPFDEYAHCYWEGKAAIVATPKNVPSSVVDARSKTRFRLHYFTAKLEAAARDPDAFALLLDVHGNVSEGTGANFFIASNGVLQTPRPGSILEGISRRVVLQIAQELGIPTQERDLTLYDVYNADEGFWTTSSYCLLPLSKVNHARIGKETPGPLTSRILSAWSEKAGVDIVGQAMKYRNRPSNVWRESGQPEHARA